MSKLPQRKPETKTCFWCDANMFLDNDRWTCSSCGWQMPNREICPRCWAPLPEEEGPGGEKICPECGYELWPPRDMPGEPKEVWYHPPGMEPYKVGEGRPVNRLVPVVKRKGGGRRRSRYKSPLQRRLEDWQKRRRHSG